MFIPMLQRQLGFNQFAIEKNLDDLTDDEALQTPIAGASSLNWVLGHILATRRYLHQMTGTDTPWETGALDVYNQGTSPDSASAVPLATLLGHFAASQTMLMQGLSAMNEADMQVEPKDVPLGEKTKAESFSGLAFHEAYHAGQLGVLRRAAGKDGAIA